MCNKIKCQICNNVMAYKGKIEDPEENTYKDMFHCITCDSYIFIKSNEYEK
ncbi:hypothetical protein [uncultured Clostridium sp.]|uniref:hypothetical protein n=1 Tax=uncultured Clostridium sp. TaxID=59620 RepID=UPI0025F9BDA9|nr:hypothetical protein [uncultured Clostridium sp.]